MKTATAESLTPTAPTRALESADPKTATALKLWVVLARAFNAVSERSQADIVKHDLTPGEFAVLELLYHKGPTLLGEIQKRVLVSSGGITFLVDRLTQRGLVERRNCPTDRRARYAALTHDGEKLLRRIFPGHAEAMAEAVSGLSAAEQKAATALLKKLGHSAAAQAG
ncbi:MAG: MarR family transcriptional regulator [Gemmatimonadetes bacterium]|nr:MarR family transcriptional regulator [Gemmatimonadota bacterium]